MGYSCPAPQGIRFLPALNGRGSSEIPLNTFKSNNLPLIVGEFSPYDAYGNVDEDTILSTTHSLGYGCLGWSWSGNSSDLSYLDQVSNFDGNSITTWGNRLWFGTDGIYYTSTQASVY